MNKSKNGLELFSLLLEDPHFFLLDLIVLWLVCKRSLLFMIEISQVYYFTSLSSSAPVDALLETSEYPFGKYNPPKDRKFWSLYFPLILSPLGAMSNRRGRSVCTLHPTASPQTIVLRLCHLLRSKIKNRKNNVLR